MKKNFYDFVSIVDRSYCVCVFVYFSRDVTKCLPFVFSSLLLFSMRRKFSIFSVRAVPLFCFSIRWSDQLNLRRTNKEKINNSVVREKQVIDTLFTAEQEDSTISYESCTYSNSHAHTPPITNLYYTLRSPLKPYFCWYFFFSQLFRSDCNLLHEFNGITVFTVIALGILLFLIERNEKSNHSKWSNTTRQFQFDRVHFTSIHCFRRRLGLVSLSKWIQKLR